MNTLYEKILRFHESGAYEEAIRALDLALVQYVHNNVSLVIAFPSDIEYLFGLRAMKLGGIGFYAENFEIVTL